MLAASSGRLQKPTLAPVSKYYTIKLAICILQEHRLLTYLQFNGPYMDNYPNCTSCQINLLWRTVSIKWHDLTCLSIHCYAALRFWTKTTWQTGLTLYCSHTSQPGMHAPPGGRGLSATQSRLHRQSGKGHTNSVLDWRQTTLRES